MMAPGATPIARPSSEKARRAEDITGISSIVPAASRLPATMKLFERPRRSLRRPPSGTDTIVSHVARLTTPLASARVAPRAISSVGPNTMITTMLALKQPHTKPPAPASRASAAESGKPGAGTEAQPAEVEATLSEALTDETAGRCEQHTGQHVESG